MVYPREGGKGGGRGYVRERDEERGGIERGGTGGGGASS